MSDLDTVRGRVAQVLSDNAAAIYSQALLDEAIRQTVQKFSLSSPQRQVAVVTLASSDREISLAALTGLLGVLEVEYPYGADLTAQRMHGWRLRWQAGEPWLVISGAWALRLYAGQQLRLWYAARHTLADLDGASQTSLDSLGEAEIQLSALVEAAAGAAATMRGQELIQTPDADLYAAGMLVAWGTQRLRLFQMHLDSLRSRSTRQGAPWSAAWQLDR